MALLLASSSLAGNFATAANAEFEVSTYEYLPEAGRAEVEFRINVSPLKAPTFFGVFFRDPVFGDIPLARGAATACPNKVCRIQLEDNNQTRRYLGNQPAVKSLFVMEVQDPANLQKYLDSAKVAETEAQKVKKRNYQIFPILSYSSLAISEKPQVFFTSGNRQAAFNDAKYSRRLSFAPEYDLRLYSQYFYLRFKRYSVYFATRGFFSSVDEAPVESRQIDTTVAMGLQGLELWGSKPTLAVYRKSRDFSTSLEDDYSILSTRTKSYGLELSLPIPLRFEVVSFGPAFSLSSDFVFASTHVSVFSPAEDYGPFLRGTGASSQEIAFDATYFFRIGSKHALLNDWLLGFGGAYERSAISFTGDYEVPPIYQGSPFNSGSRSKLSQFQLRLSLSREIRF